MISWDIIPQEVLISGTYMIPALEQYHPIPDLIFIVIIHFEGFRGPTFFRQVLGADCEYNGWAGWEERFFPKMAVFT